MRLGWTTSKYSTTYRAVKAIRVNGKNKTQIVKSFGTEKFICETYGVSDAKAWAKEQVRLMDEAEKEDSAKFNIELCAAADLVTGEQHRFNGGYLFLQDIQGSFIQGSFTLLPKRAALGIRDVLSKSRLLNSMTLTVPSLSLLMNQTTSRAACSRTALPSPGGKPA